MNRKEVILGVCGSIACFKAVDLVSRFIKIGYSVSVVMTKEAEEFITPLTFAVMSQNKVYRSMFADPEAWDAEHISLADKADLVVIAPATANIISKITNGICDDLLTCVVCAIKAKVLIAPAMNENMWRNKIIQQNVSKLKKLGYKFVGPVKGRLACGVEGVGCLAPVDEILKEAAVLLKQ
jgi:phosphopantothenoylcysteine decarboxylase/phosphopantothenate--cysteine ligase